MGLIKSVNRVICLFANGAEEARLVLHHTVLMVLKIKYEKIVLVGLTSRDRETAAGVVGQISGVKS